MEITRDLALTLAGQWMRDGFAVAWTAANTGDEAKIVKSKSWQDTPPVSQYTVEQLAGMIAQRLPAKNPVCTARTSGLILIDCDSQHDVAAFKSFDPPLTRSVYTSKARHYYYRAPADWDGRFSGIYFEAGAITPKTNCYLVMPPALHPTGHQYEWVNEEIPIAELPMDVYLKMVGAAEDERDETTHALAADENAVIPEGQRHTRLLSMLGNMRRNGASRETALAAALDLNQHRFAKPKPAKVIERVVDDVYGRYDPEGLASREQEEKKGWVDLSAVTRKSIRFADKPILQWGAFHLLTGKGGSCKGTYTALLAAEISHGGLHGMDHGGRTYFISSEDDEEIDLLPRLDAAGADTTMVRSYVGDFRLPADMGVLWSVVQDDPLCRCIIIDPVSNHLGSGKDGNSETDVRDALAALNDFAADNNIMVIGVRHLRKDSTTGALAGVLGSTAWVDLPRAVIVMARDNINENRFHMELVKGNRGPLAGSGRVFDLELVEFDDLEEPITRVVRNDEATFKSVDSLLAAPTKFNRALSALLDILPAFPGTMPAEEAKEEVCSQVECGKDTVYNAFKALVKEGRAAFATSGWGAEKETNWYLVPEADW